jgi:hypothetical protein
MTSARIRQRGIFRRTAWIAVWALVLQMLLPLIHHPAAAKAGPPDGLRICAVMGLMPTGKAEPSKTPVSKIPSCPICQTLHMLNGGFVPPDISVLAIPSEHDGSVGVVAVANILPHIIITGAQPRAPPVHV